MVACESGEKGGYWSSSVLDTNSQENFHLDWGSCYAANANVVRFDALWLFPKASTGLHIVHTVAGFAATTLHTAHAPIKQAKKGNARSLTCRKTSQDSEAETRITKDHVASSRHSEILSPHVSLLGCRQGPFDLLLALERPRPFA